MKRLILFLWLAAAWPVWAQHGEGRIALVVGNSQYTAGNEVPNAANDASLMAATLEELGFLVFKHTNASKRQMDEAIAGFKKHLKYNTVTLVYYAGHTVSHGGRHYMVPADAKLSGPADLAKQAVDWEQLFALLRHQPEAINIVIADVFRELKYADWATHQFANVAPPGGTLLALASSQGFPSGESDAGLGLYTQKLTAQMKVHQELATLFEKTREGIAETGNVSQKPVELGSLNGKFYFKTSPLQSSLLTNNAEVYLVPKTEEPATLRVNCTMKGKFFLGQRVLGNFEPNSIYNLPNIAPGKYTLRLNNWSIDLIMESGKTYEIVTGEQTKVNKEVVKPVVDKSGVDMVHIQGGSFMMGSPQGDKDELPQHQVTVGDFSLSRTEVTNEQYARFLNAIGCPASGQVADQLYIKMSDEDVGLVFENGKFAPKTGFEHFPVVEVTWFGADAYCKWADGRLPTEAEWEYAARGGQDGDLFVFSGSNRVNEVAWHVENSKLEGSFRDYDIHPVGQKAPNALGLYDMSGNVWEWCADWYAPYTDKHLVNPTGPASGSYRALRGGSARFEISRCRVAYRYSRTPQYSNDDRGFRLARDVNK